MTTTADALEVMALISACHPRTAPRMDDRDATLAMATVWADLFSEWNLELADLKAAVKKRVLEGLKDAPEPAEIITLARSIRAVRTQSESRAEREARENAWDQKLLEANKRRLARELRGFGKSVPELRDGEAESA